MNPGYLSYVIISICLILLASGWKDILLRGISHTRILLFFIGWIPCSWLSISMAGFHLKLTALFLPAVALACTWAMKDSLTRVHVWSAGLLLGSFDLLMRELNGWQMLLQQLGPTMNSTVVLAVLTYLLGRNPTWQFVAVTAGLAASDWVHVWLHRSAAPEQVIGGASFSDHWWLIFCALRGLTVAMEQSFRLSAASYKHWTSNRKDWGD